MAFDKTKTILELRRIQKELKRIELEVEAGNGAVKLVVNGEQKVQSIVISPDLMQADNQERLQNYLMSAFNQAITRSQQEAADKMKNVAGGLGLPGL